LQSKKAINYKDGTTYFGKKQVRFKTKIPLRKDGKSRDNVVDVITKRVKLTKEELDKRAPSDNRVSKLQKFEVVEKINDSWKKYNGSGTTTPHHSKIKRKTILALCSNKTTLTYLEAYVIFKNHAVVNKKCHNLNILGKFWDNAMDGYIKTKE